MTAKLCEEHDIRHENIERIEAVVNWLETQYPSPAFPARREDGPAERRAGRAYLHRVRRREARLPGDARDRPDPAADTRPKCSSS